MAGTPHEARVSDRLDPDKPLNLTAWGEIRWHARPAWRLLTGLWYAIRGLLP